MPATDSQILTVPEHSVVLAEEFDKSDQKVEELFEELKAKTGVFFDLVLEVYNANHELFKTLLGSLRAEENIDLIGNTWLMLANHYRSVLERFRELKAEIDKATSKGAESIPPDIFDPATVKTVINFSIERLARFEKRSRQLADMHGADIRA